MCRDGGYRGKEDLGAVEVGRERDEVGVTEGTVRVGSRSVTL